MEEKAGFGKRLSRYLFFLISNFSFFIAAILSLSYFYPVARAFIWQQKFILIISIIIVSAIVWMGTALAYIFTE